MPSQPAHGPAAELSPQSSLRGRAAGEGDRRHKPSGTGASGRHDRAGPAGVLLPLQRAAGNQAVAQLIAQRGRPPPIRTIQRQDEGAGPSEPLPLAPLDDVSGEPVPDTADATNYRRSISLEGKTTARFSESSNSYRSENVRLSRAADCDGCADDDPCVNVAATIVNTYQVPISVRLPDLSSMDLTECEREQAQEWIDTVLAPHEQEHVAAFETYNGTTRHPLTFTACRSAAQGELDTRAQSMHASEQSTRQSSAQADSDELDPFNSTIDIDCPDEETDEQTDEQTMGS